MTTTALDRPTAGFRGLVAAEWTKFRTVRSSYWTLVIAAGLTIGIGLAWQPIMVDLNEGATAANPAAEGWWYEGLHVGILAMMILGALTATAEYSTGTIRATLAAVPSRWRVFAAKAVTIAAITLITGVVQAIAVFLLAQPILASHGLDVPPTDPAAWRGVVWATLAMAAAGLFGLGFGLLIRHTAGAIGAIVAVIFVVGLLGSLLPDSLSIDKFLPANALYAMFTPGGEDFLTAAPGAAVFSAYVAVLVGAAAASLHRRDTA